jgi:hypothetical protein
MASCDAAHSEFDRHAGKGNQVGSLPEWTRVRGRVVYRVLRGAYEQLPGAWAEFVPSAMARGPPTGPAGDVYLCTPGEHEEERLLTILYLPIA